MNRRVLESFGFLKTTAIGGLFFLLPLVVIGVLVGQVARVVWAVAVEVNQVLPTQTFVGYSLVIGISIGLIVLACFACGVFARRRFARQFSESVEKYVLMMFPRYAILKEQLTGNIGGEVLRNSLQPVLVRLPGHSRLGFEIERYAEHEDAGGAVRESVTVYLPGSPDPWSGQTIVVQSHNVEQLASPFGETVAAFEQLGRGTQHLIHRYRGNLTSLEANTTS
jgi:uncharacterized membrane protein